MAIEDLARGAAFATFGRAGTYTPPGGTATACRVILAGADAEQQVLGSRFVAGQMTVEVRASEIAAPVQGGVFTVGAETFTIVQAPRREDRDRALWTCLCKVSP